MLSLSNIILLYFRITVIIDALKGEKKIILDFTSLMSRAHLFRMCF